MRIKDSPKNNAESNKKENKRKIKKQKADIKGTVTNDRKEKDYTITKTEKEGQKQSLSKDNKEEQVNGINSSDEMDYTLFS